MKAGDLINVVRLEIVDTAKPYLVSDDELLEFIDDAQNEACRRASLLIDASSSFCTIAARAGQHSYDLNSRIIRIRRATFDGERLGQETTAALDAGSRGWDDMAGFPRVYLTDWESNRIRLVPEPDDAGTLKLRVVRLPLKPVTDEGQQLEIHERFHRDLRYWVIKRCYEKQDSDMKDDAKAALYESKFEAAFGPPLSARTEQWNAQHLPAGSMDGSE